MVECRRDRKCLARIRTPNDDAPLGAGGNDFAIMLDERFQLAVLVVERKPNQQVLANQGCEGRRTVFLGDLIRHQYTRAFGAMYSMSLVIV